MIGATAALFDAVRDRLRPVASGGVNHVALGTFCHTASALRTVGLRRWTGPLDWIFTTPGMIAECLADGFKTLVDPAHFASVPPSELMKGSDRQCRHLYYEERYGLPTLFNHHDPVRSAGDRAALSRAVARMEGALRGARPNVFYMMSEVRWPEPEIAEMLRVLGSFPTRNLLVVATLSGGSAGPAWRLGEIAEGRAARVDLDLEVASRSLGTKFAEPADDALLATALQETAATLERALKRHI